MGVIGIVWFWFIWFSLFRTLTGVYNPCLCELSGLDVSGEGLSWTFVVVTEATGLCSLSLCSSIQDGSSIVESTSVGLTDWFVFDFTFPAAYLFFYLADEFVCEAFEYINLTYTWKSGKHNS